ncbi:MAG: TlpA family protein disulfide reductase [Calditrichaceae bacterium]
MRSRFMIYFTLILLQTVLAGRTIPDFKLKNIDNKWTNFSELKGGNVTVIDFWATWCKPCAKALPKLNKLSEQFKNSGVAFIGINVDSPRNSAKIKPFAKTYKISYPILLDPNSSFASELGIINIPTLLIINSDREIIYIHKGYRSGDENIIEEEILKILNSPESKVEK